MASLIPELLLLQEREGWLRDEALEALATRLRLPLHRLESVVSFYPHFRRQPPRGRRVEVCRDLSCSLRGGREARKALEEATAGGDAVEWVEVSCLGRCDRAPAAALEERPFVTTDPKARLFVEGREAVPGARPQAAWPAADPYAEGGEHYASRPGLLEREPGHWIRLLADAGLRGMGGAAFPTGRKWSLVAEAVGRPKFVVCNADESEPGTFKDREILHDLPHLVIEGMLIAAAAVGAEQGFVFIRHEYAPERRRLEDALKAARESGALGATALGPGRPFEIDVFVSPGGYILGEETALLECMEDRRGEPRNKPPFPGTAGLRGRPTLINNVETFAHAAAIAVRGEAWWRSLGRRGHIGHKFIAVSGDVERPGVQLVPFGTTFGELLEGAGGMLAGRGLGVFAPGGASSRFLGPEDLETEIDFDAVAERGSMLGSGAVVFVAEDRDWLEVGLSVTRFFRNESCGKCVPCRVGTEKAVAAIEAEGQLSPGLVDQLVDLDQTLARTSICGLGQVALSPLLSLAARSSPDARSPAGRRES